MISSGLRTGIQSKNKKITLLALGFFFMFGYSNVSYLLPVYYAGVGFTAAQSGLLVSSFYFATLIFRLLLGNLLVKSGFKRFLAIGGVASVAGSVWIVFAGDSFSAPLPRASCSARERLLRRSPSPPTSRWPLRKRSAVSPFP